jgi:uncharacterized membrane protein HdeD (DUF308 family)
MTAQPADPVLGVPIGVRLEAMNAVLAKNWWALALRGIVAILFAGAALLIPHLTLLSLIFLFAIYMILDGVFELAAAVRAAQRHSRWGLMVLQAIACFLVAAAALFVPGLTVLAFVYLIAAWAVVTGGFGLAAAFKLNQDHGRIWMAVGGVASIIFGVLLAIAPLLGALVLTWWLGIYALIFGVCMLALAFRLRSHQHDHPGHTAMAAPA